MKTTRRQFIKRGAGAISITLLAPRFLRGVQAAPSTPDHRILVVLNLTGGNDGFSTVIPYSDAHYHTLRPTLGFSESELGGTIIDGDFAFHPALTELKQLYDAGKAAVVLGVGYPDPDLSHGVSNEVWQTANRAGGAYGWLGRYADIALAQSSLQLPAAAVGQGYAPKAFYAQTFQVPSFSRLGESSVKFSEFLDRDNVIKAFRDLNGRNFPADSPISRIASVGGAAENQGGLLDAAAASYSSSVKYDDNSPVGQALKSVAILASSFPDSAVFHVAYPAFFDTHAQQIGSSVDGFTNRMIGTQAVELQRLSQALKNFHDDMTQHGLADNLVLMTYSEFGRAPKENSSSGTDHGTASVLFAVGNPVKGGALYGAQPSLNPSDFDSAGNVKFTTDFRRAYSTLLNRWLSGDHAQAVLGGTFEPLDFL